ncbi:T9SS type A sorting domain-containing protein [Aequorivita marisscotiae]|uniref:T9SS type A sorting domain-containing protein n=1 Tax=Aequorivita marisscotiae TaxID=3040348 RepID=A0ABY8KTW4_9FLAO|nr:T9SS type A sorting domain-containing protein [Aequorivita sp. Ant34-E75]WGF92576.1 T9SS type A sorting domain-containing protein [Aequorivita sp. Ant34-E75]
MKKITIMMFLFVAAIGFSQEQVKMLGNDNPVIFEQQRTEVNQTTIMPNNAAPVTDIALLGNNNPTYLAACTEENPNDGTFENGFNCSSASAFMTANDITVAADENFTLTNITASIFANGGITNVDVNYYDDAAGLPGALIGSQASATIDNQTVIGNNFGFDVNEVEMSVTPFVFNGQAGSSSTYWIELSVTDGGATGSVFWVVTSSTMEGNPSAQFDAAWGIPDPLMDGVYIWEGDCDPIGGGGGACQEENPNDGTFENGFNCSSASAFMTANDVTVAAGEDFELTNITASIFANGGITNVDVNYYDDAAGLPGNLIGSQASATIDNQTVIGNNFGFDVNEIELTVTPFTFAGQAGSPTTYWVELSVTDGGATGSVFWVVTSSTMVGNPSAQFDAAWGIPDPLMDGVYIWEGNCNPLGVSDNALAGFSYYPNPVTDVLSLKAASNIEAVSIYNLLGQEVLRSEVGATTSDINLSGITTGAYVLKVTVNGQTGTYKILKN